jgi:hypothetical protein
MGTEAKVKAKTRVRLEAKAWGMARAKAEARVAVIEEEKAREVEALASFTRVKNVAKTSMAAATVITGLQSMALGQTLVSEY